MVLRLLVLAGIAAVGVLKAGALLVIGLAMDAPPLALSAAAALWVTGPPTVAWLVARRRGATARPTPAG